MEVIIDRTGPNCGDWEYGELNGSWDVDTGTVDISWMTEAPGDWEDIEQLIETKILESYD